MTSSSSAYRCMFNSLNSLIMMIYDSLTCLQVLGKLLASYLPESGQFRKTHSNQDFCYLFLMYIEGLGLGYQTELM